MSATSRRSPRTSRSTPAPIRPTACRRKVRPMPPTDLDPILRRLEALNQADPSVGQLAALVTVAARAAGEAAWAEAGRTIEPGAARGRLKEGIPALHGATLPVDVERVRSLFAALADAARRAGNEGGEAAKRA